MDTQITSLGLVKNIGIGGESLHKLSEILASLIYVYLQSRNLMKHYQENHKIDFLTFQINNWSETSPAGDFF